MTLMKYIADPSNYRHQMIGADRRSIDRTLFNKYGAPRCVIVTRKSKAKGPTIRFSFNSVGWPKRHQAFFFKELRVNSIEECHNVYLTTLIELKETCKLSHQSYLALKSSWREFISAYDHYFK